MQLTICSGVNNDIGASIRVYVTYCFDQYTKWWAISDPVMFRLISDARDETNDKTWQETLAKKWAV